MTKREAREPVQIQRRTVRVRSNRYQPNKAELEAPVEIRKADGTRPSVEELVDAVLAPVEIVKDPEA